jgi:Fungalysin metallopeptidase (M36)
MPPGKLLMSDTGDSELSRPSAWSALEVTNRALDDVVGTAGIDVEKAAGSLARSFQARARDVSVRGSLMLSAQRPFQVGAFASAPEVMAGVVGDVAALQPPGSDVKVLATLDSLTGRHVVAQQVIREHAVVGARFTVHLDAAGAYALTGNPLGDLTARDPGPPPPFDAAAVCAQIGGRYNVESVDAITVKQVVFPSAGGAEWAYFAQLPIADPRADVRAFFGATADLPLLVSYVTSVASLFGEGNVYAVNPLRTPDLELVCLRGLGPVPPDQLTGETIAVAPRAGAALIDPRRYCKLSPDDAGFDQVAAFHHVTEAYWYYSRLVHQGLFDTDAFRPLRVFVNDAQNPNNAFYFPDRGELAFGDFAGRPSARSADMVFHEFGHAVTHAIARLADTNQQQARALGEGYSDYFACSAMNDPRFGDYVTNRPDGARSCNQAGLTFSGDRDHAEEHKLGEVWANTLWDIRTAFGAGITDLLAMESVYYLQPTPTLDRAHWALREADRILFPQDDSTGRHAEMIDNAWSARFPTV